MSGQERARLTFALSVIVAFVSPAASHALGTAFTYQGQLQQSGAPASGTCDFRFSLYDAAANGTQIGATELQQMVPVQNGLFTSVINEPGYFGSAAFDGSDRWLQVDVRCPSGAGSFTTLAPRQRLTATPYAFYAPAAGVADDLLCGSCVESNELADGAVTSAKIAGGTIQQSNLAFTPGTVTSIMAGTGLTGGTVTTSGTIAANIGTTAGTVAAGDHTHEGAFWVLGGNAGTTYLNNSIGTTDNQPLDLKVFGSRALRLEPRVSPNLIGGWQGNTVVAPAVGATIAGGGAPDDGYGVPAPNQVLDNYGTIGGGIDNQAGSESDYARYATVAGGLTNKASGEFSVVGGGGANSAGGSAATVTGGVGNSAGAVGATVGGGRYNNILAGASLATIAGGGTDGNRPGNAACDSYGTIGGGAGNWAGSKDCGPDAENAVFATVSGGESNKATSTHASIGGGALNEASDLGATVAGGRQNMAIAGVGPGTVGCATVGGGTGNTAAGAGATVGGGFRNQATAAFATIAGGGPSDVNNPLGTLNGVIDDYGTIGGGGGNRAGSFDLDTTNAPYATVSGGEGNAASNMHATIGGGIANAAAGPRSTVGGGYHNQASGNAATVPGGSVNVASGAYSFAAGAQAQATHAGSFVWSSDVTTSSWGNNTFTARAPGGFRFYFDSGTGYCQLSDGNGWQCASGSDRDTKTDVAAVNGGEVLEHLSQVPIHTWRYRAAPRVRHIGPMAQDFVAAFGVGADDTHINTVDADGVALAAIQGLYRLVQEKDARIDALEARLAALEAARPWEVGNACEP